MGSTQRVNDAHVTPQRMAAAGVPMALARWFHLIGRKLISPSMEDRRRIDDIHWTVSRFGS